MIFELFKQIKIALRLLVFFTFLTGILYPFLTTGLAQLFFPHQANGSLIMFKGNIIGSELIGQFFSDQKYFWGRPSATLPYPYNAANSSGSHVGPLDPELLSRLHTQIEYIQHNNLKDNVRDNTKIPVDWVTLSASGLDPEISPLAAFYQADRIAKVRHLSETMVHNLINKNIQSHLGGEPRVNVLQLNRTLDSEQFQ